MVRFMISCCTAAWILAVISTSAAPQYAQYYPPPSYYGLPPCQAVTPGPLRGAARVRPKERCSERSEEMPGAVRRLVRA